MNSKYVPLHLSTCSQTKRRPIFPQTPIKSTHHLPQTAPLQFSLLSLLSLDPTLAFYDLTIAYSGGDASSSSPHSAQTISSLFSSLSPSLSNTKKEIHIHLRKFDLESVPGVGFAQKEEAKGNESLKKVLTAVERDDAISDEERDAFGKWLQGRWTEKEALLASFRENGKFPVPFEEEEKRRVVFEVALRDSEDWVSCAPFFFFRDTDFLCWWRILFFFFRGSIASSSVPFSDYVCHHEIASKSVDVVFDLPLRLTLNLRFVR